MYKIKGMKNSDMLWKKYYQIIMMDLFADLGNRLVVMALLNQLVFQNQDTLKGLVAMEVIHQVPGLIFSLWAGRQVDRVGDRRWLLLVISVKCTLVGILTTASSRMTILGVYLVFTISSTFFGIGRYTLVRRRIKRQMILAFNSLNERVAFVFGLFTPMVIGFYVLRFGGISSFYLAAVMYLITIEILFGMDPDSSEGDEGSLNIPIENQPKIHTALCDMVAYGFVVLGSGVLTIGLPYLYKTGFKGTVAGWGVIMGAYQVGSLIGSVMFSSQKIMRNLSLVSSLCCLGCASGMVFLARATGTVQIILLMTLLGSGFTMLQIFWESRIQAKCSKDLAGRFMGMLFGLRAGCYLGATGAGATLLYLLNPSFLFVLGGLFLILPVLLANSCSVFKAER